MKLTRTSVGLAVRAAREAASLTLSELSTMTGLSVSALSRSETANRDLGYTEIISIAKALEIDLEELRTLAETFQRSGASETQEKRNALSRDLNELQRTAIEAAVEARANNRKSSPSNFNVPT